MERCKFNDTPEENHNSWWLKLVPESVSETPHTVCGRCFGSDIVWSASDFVGKSLALQLEKFVKFNHIL